MTSYGTSLPLSLAQGENTSYRVSELALEGFSWMRGALGRAGPRALAAPFFNDEADPLVSWMIPVRRTAARDRQGSCRGAQAPHMGMPWLALQHLR